MNTVKKGFQNELLKKIVEIRRKRKIETTKELVDIVFEATPRIKSKIHPATRIFQAIRIEVNHELDNIKNTLNDVLTLLGNNAILSVVTFHSLEDRIVKNFIKYYSREWMGTDWMFDYNPPLLEQINKKPITASEDEIKINPPSRSAKLRIARRINKKQ